MAGKEPFILRRDDAYIGVLIDDLITKGVDEPYRMFTSRAEYRILLRQDNADQRLTPLGYKIGLASRERYEACEAKYKAVEELEAFCNSHNLRADKVNAYLESKGSAPLTESKKIADVAARPEVTLAELLTFVPRGTEFSPEVIESVEINIRYKGYIERERSNAEKISHLENLRIPEGFDFSKVEGLSIECRQKLARYKPDTIARASRISGVSPSDISVLLVYFGR